ncbi:MAG: Crp/Fnr family transcriptional regulator [Methylotenera sp.]
MNTLLKALPNTSINILPELSSDTLGPRQNHLLAALPYSELSLWEHELELVDLKLGQILCEPGVKHTHVIFPTTAIVSLLYMTQEGTSSEIAIVGNDGVVGVSVFMGGNETPNQAMVQSSGQGYRLRTQTAKNVVNRDGPLLHMLLRYTQTMITQIAQTAVCNRHHSIDQQLCRRLLLGLDRLPADDLVMTQELLASLLGVRRESVTTAALKLQEAGVINYCRGHITVLNRKMLEHRCCECYAMVKKEQDRLMPFMPEFHPAVQPSVSMAYSL